MIESENIMGVMTDTFHLSSIYRTNDCSIDNPGKTLQIFFIAGNPGILHFYTSFLQKLLKGLEDGIYFTNYDRISCHGVGHANHHLQGSLTCKASNGIDDDSQYFGLEFQICHKLAFITSILEKDMEQSGLNNENCRNNTEVMMIGHSIGAYMVIESLTRSERLMQLTVDVILLMPFISWSHLPILHRTKLSTFVLLQPYSHRLITALASPLLQMEPSMRRNFLGRVTGMKGDILNTMSDGLICKRLLENFLVMGADEIRDVRVNQGRMFSLLEELDRGKSCRQKNILLLYTDNDEWAPMNDATTLKGRLDRNTTVVIEPGLTHAFSMTDQKADRTCEIILNHFENLNQLKIKRFQTNKESENSISRQKIFILSRL